MNLQWEKHDYTWFLRDKDVDELSGNENTYAIVYERRGRFTLSWWFTLDEKEPRNEGEFKGTPEEMKAYVLALVRFGVTE